MSATLARPSSLPVDPASGAEYLVGYGKSGAFGRFVAVPPVNFRRGDRVVIETTRGLETGTVLCPATSGHSQLLATVVPGRIVRPLRNQDEDEARRLQLLSRQVLAEAQKLAVQRELALEILDVDILLDGTTALIQYLGPKAVDQVSVFEPLRLRHGLEALLMENLSSSGPPTEEDGGCGKPDCGRGNGGCTTCSTGGGCSSCGTGKVDMTAYFAHLRSKMDAQARTSLL